MSYDPVKKRRALDISHWALEAVETGVGFGVDCRRMNEMFGPEEWKLCRSKLLFIEGQLREILNMVQDHTSESSSVAERAAHAVGAIKELTYALETQTFRDWQLRQPKRSKSKRSSAYT